jgi:hypothetical protein
MIADLLESLVSTTPSFVYYLGEKKGLTAHVVATTSGKYP